MVFPLITAKKQRGELSIYEWVQPAGAIMSSKSNGEQSMFIAVRVLESESIEN
jgi:hypothetical protein